jgi:hypothetical protein
MGVSSCFVPRGTRSDPYRERRLRRKPTDEEVEKALAALHETQRKRTGREPAQ